MPLMSTPSRSRNFSIIVPFVQVVLMHCGLFSAAFVSLETAIATTAISARPSVHIPSAAAIEPAAAASAALMTLLSHCLAHLKEIEDCVPKSIPLGSANPICSLGHNQT